MNQNATAGTDAGKVEKLTETAGAANRYDLTALLQQVCEYDTPDNVRRELSTCYFMLVRELDALRSKQPREVADPLEALGAIVEALDAVTVTDNPPLIVAPAGGAALSDAGDDCTPAKGITVTLDGEEVYLPNYRHVRRTPEYYRDAISRAELRAYQANARAGVLADIIEYAYGKIGDRLTPDEVRGLNEFKRERWRAYKDKITKYREQLY